LTLLAWALLAWLLRGQIYLLYDFFRPPVFELTAAVPPDFGSLWGRLEYFVILASVLIVWLVIWAVIDRRRLAARERVPQPPPLTIAEQARGSALDEKTLDAARRLKIATVHFGEDGAIAGFDELSELRL